MERICKNCKFFKVTGASFDQRSKEKNEIGVCQKPRGSAKKIRGKLVGGEPMYDNDSCRSFRVFIREEKEKKLKKKHKK
jgi:hypothetical protein